MLGVKLRAALVYGSAIISSKGRTVLNRMVCVGVFTGNGVMRFVVGHRDELLIVAGLFLVFASCQLWPPSRVGDGAEYYAMFLSWAKSWRPFLTEVDWENYRALQRGGSIQYMVAVEHLRSSFPYLVKGQAPDLIHFWFYSFCAALNHRALASFGLSISPHTCFLLLHWELSCIVSLLAFRSFGTRGLAALALLVLSSPILWYVNKVHTEFFTFTLTVSAAICLLRNKNLAAAMFLALASTQNISFGAIAILPLVFEISTRQHRLKYSLPEVVLLLVTASALLIHPAYNLVRHGVYDPIMASGAATPGRHFGHFYVWFFDPDIGLFPNYPLAIVLIAIASVVIGKDEVASSRRRHLAFAAAFVGISLFAQSSTGNLNSGATPGVARYALWYLCLLFLPILVSTGWMVRQSWTRRALLLPLVAVLCVANISTSWPGRPESYSRPTLLSHTIQTFVPFLYDPPSEIFAERFGGVGEGLPKDLLAVVGPDCRKILVYKGNTRSVVLDANGCGYDLTRLTSLVYTQMRARTNPAATFYLSLGDAEVKAVAPLRSKSMAVEPFSIQ